MLQSKLGNRIIGKAQQSNIPLLQKIGRSLDRDKDFTISRLAGKSLIYSASMATAPLYLRRCNTVGKRPRTRRKPNIENAGRIEIGNDVNINSRNVQTDLVTGPDGFLKIGNEVSINFGVSIVSYNKVSIGNRVRVGPYTMIYDSNFHIQGDRYSWAEGEPVTIEDDAWLASRVMVLKGAMIGRGSVIAAGSVVSGAIPPYVVAGGVPARIIKFMKTPEHVSDFCWDISEENEEPSDEIKERVGAVIERIIPAAATSELSGKDAPGIVEEWDSIKHVHLIRALEQEFNIKFKKNDWSRLSTVGKICTVIQNYQTQQNQRSRPKIRSV